MWFCISSCFFYILCMQIFLNGHLYIYIVFMIVDLKLAFSILRSMRWPDIIFLKSSIVWKIFVGRNTNFFILYTTIKKNQNNILTKALVIHNPLECLHNNMDFWVVKNLNMFNINTFSWEGDWTVAAERSWGKIPLVVCRRDGGGAYHILPHATFLERYNLACHRKYWLCPRAVVLPVMGNTAHSSENTTGSCQTDTSISLSILTLSFPVNLYNSRIHRD